MKIVVLSGGLSLERDVSITSGSKVARALREKGHKVVLIDVFMGYEEPLLDIDSLFENQYDFSKSAVLSEAVPDIEKIKSQRKNKSNSYFGDHVIDICQKADICYLALHGGEGENGQIQAAFDLLGIKYTGSPYLGSAVSMDKAVSKSLFIYNKVPTPKSELFKPQDLQNGKIENWSSFPCVVKICNGGSSVGVEIVKTKDEFMKAVETAFSYEDKVLVEQYIKGREFSIGLLDGKALPIIEIIPKAGFYDYKNKYQSGMTDEICPADLDENIAQKMQREAEHAYKVLGLKAYARIDFLLDEDNNFYCLEANTLPGMTPMSLLPQEAAATGIDYPSLCEKIIELSLKKY